MQRAFFSANTNSDIISHGREKMKNFTFYLPVELIFGPGSIKEIGRKAASLGKKAFLSTGKSSMRRLGILQKVEESLKKAGVKYVLFEGVKSNPEVKDVDNAAVLAKKENCDLTIGLGGGSAVDFAKEVAVVAGCGGNIWDYVETDKKPSEVRPITQDTLPIIAIPTTAGTGTETTPYAVVTNSLLKLKEGFGNRFLYPKVSIVDPECMIHLPPHITAWTGMDALGQALEAFTSLYSNWATDLIAEESIRFTFHNLPKAFNKGDNLEARAKVAWGASLSGAAIAQVDANLAHAMSHPLSAHYNISHGLAVGLLTPPTMEFNLEAVPHKYKKIAHIMGVKVEGMNEREAALKSVEKVKELMKILKLPSGLQEVGIKEEDIPVLVKDTLKMGALSTNPRPVKEEDLINLFRKTL